MLGYFIMKYSLSNCLIVDYIYFNNIDILQNQNEDKNNKEERGFY